MSRVLVGSEALRRGVVTRNDLRRRYTKLWPDVYGPIESTLRDRMEGAWLWSGRRGVLAGVAASALHGARWVDRDVPIELIGTHTRSPAGLIVRRDALAEDDVAYVSGLPVTTAPRTLFDLGRRLPRDEAVARMDALLRTGQVVVADVLPLIDRHGPVRGVRALQAAMALTAVGVDSPRETWLRLALTDAGMPPEAVQIPVYEGSWMVAKIDMGWETYKVGVQYDGRHHQTDRETYVRDQRVLRACEAQDWKMIRVIAEDRLPAIVARVEATLLSRGWRRECNHVRFRAN